ncbi:hypothetical protein [Achromobacter aloeverae]|nr:hypothetical protein [Achromobacter aloeverae]
MKRFHVPLHVDDLCTPVYGASHTDAAAEAPSACCDPGRASATEEAQ